ncbi:MAG: DUF3817 domain-containing protein [Myxococcota bacterium]
MASLSTPLDRVRTIGKVEAISYLLLLGIAMPLKYAAGIPIFVKVLGWAHGVLFVVFGVVLLQAMIVLRWSIFKAAVVFLATLIPFGPFIIDKRLLREAESSS